MGAWVASKDDAASLAKFREARAAHRFAVKGLAEQLRDPINFDVLRNVAATSVSRRRGTPSW